MSLESPCGFPVKKDMQSESMGPSGVEVGSWMHDFSVQEMGGPCVCRMQGPCLVSDHRE